MELEDLLVQEGVAAPDGQIRGALERAVSEGVHPVAVLVDSGIVSEDVIAEVLARAAHTIVVEIDANTIDLEGATLISADVARLHLMIPLGAPKGGSLRAALVNPLDDDAIAALETVSGTAVQPVAATLSAVRRAIDQCFRDRTARVRAAASEMPPENTRKVENDTTVRPDTAPVHRLEEDATIEQRHQALLLALVERGILTRAEYMDALKRLLSGRS